jgi:hypothetical protein
VKHSGVSGAAVPKGRAEPDQIPQTVPATGHKPWPDRLRDTGAGASPLLPAR